VNAIRREVREAIESVVREQLRGVRIDAVHVTPDVDQDGERLLRVKVVFDSKARGLDPRKTSGLVRHMRPRIAELGEQAFPILSFISKAEYRAAKSEAA
jgi:hypothetical protein